MNLQDINNRIEELEKNNEIIEANARKVFTDDRNIYFNEIRKNNTELKILKEWLDDKESMLQKIDKLIHRTKEYCSDYVSNDGKKILCYGCNCRISALEDLKKELEK